MTLIDKMSFLLIPASEKANCFGPIEIRVECEHTKITGWDKWPEEADYRTWITIDRSQRYSRWISSGQSGKQYWDNNFKKWGKLQILFGNKSHSLPRSSIKYKLLMWPDKWPTDIWLMGILLNWCFVAYPDMNTWNVHWMFIGNIYR